MADLSELKAKIEEAKIKLQGLQAQLEMAEKQGRGETPVADAPADADGQDEAPAEDAGEQTFSEAVEKSLQETAPETAVVVAAMEKPEPTYSDGKKDNKHLLEFFDQEKLESGESADPEKQPSEPELDSIALFETVYTDGGSFDVNSKTDQQKMDTMRNAIEGDPRVAELAATDPERVSLYMYGPKSGW